MEHSYSFEEKYVRTTHYYLVCVFGGESKNCGKVRNIHQDYEVRSSFLLCRQVCLVHDDEL